MSEEKEEKKGIVNRARKIIYILEAANLHQKNPKSDMEMVEAIIKQIRNIIEEESLK